MRTKIASLLAAAFSLGIVQAASAADMPTKAPVLKAPIVAPWNWAGFYAGAEIGAAWVHDALTETTAFVPPLTGNATSNNTAFVGGGYFGYN